MSENSVSVPKSSTRYGALDGWRGISILCVLGAHMLPLGPKSLLLNDMFGTLGMCIFFTLSGFLITTTLISRPSIRDFIIRRFFRIIPLAWLFLLLVLPMVKAKWDAYPAHFLFYANWPPFWLTEMTAHFWSLCAEMQFYIGIAIIVGLLGKRGLMLIPAICLAVTLGRIYNGVLISIETYYRIDEILVGSCLALIYQEKLGPVLPKFLLSVNSYLLFGLLLISCHSTTGPANYLRPYLAASLVGSTLYQQDTKLSHVLKNSVLAYIAEISYALYVIHPLSMYGWLGSGDKIVIYAKRPLAFLITFALSHLSTFYYEKRWIALAKSLTK